MGGGEVGGGFEGVGGGEGEGEVLGLGGEGDCALKDRRVVLIGDGEMGPES